MGTLADIVDPSQLAALRAAVGDDDIGPDEVKRDFSSDERDKAADKGHALPDGSFPIKSREDVKNAVQALGRAKDKAAAKRHIKKRAKALGCTELLPDDWTNDGDGDETKALRHVRTPEGAREYGKPIGSVLGGGSVLNPPDWARTGPKADAARAAVHGSGSVGEAHGLKEGDEVEAGDIRGTLIAFNATTGKAAVRDEDGKLHPGVPLADVKPRKREAKDDGEYETKTTAEPLPAMEHKNDNGSMVVTTDDDSGLVEAIVSVTGIPDRVDDVIHPGAYSETLAAREPIGVWSHDDKTWVARAEEVKELPPGDPYFSTPEFVEARKGKPWPKGAGGLLVKARFNLETPHGAAAYSDVKFFKGHTGWSIGYRVKNAKRDVRTGQRHIKSLDLYEFSPVMVGAAPDSMTLSVKSLAGAHAVDPDEPPALPDVDPLEVKDLLIERDDLEAWLDMEEKRGRRRTSFGAGGSAPMRGGRGGVRHVETPEGARKYGKPIGSVITAADEARVRQGGGGRPAPGTERRVNPLRDAGSGPGSTAPGQVRAKNPPAAERAYAEAENRRAQAAHAKTKEEAAVLQMEADVLERFGKTLDERDAEAYDTPGADPAAFHGGQPKGLKRLLGNKPLKHLRHAEKEAAVAIVAVEAATMLSHHAEIMGHGQMAMAIGAHLLVGAGAAINAARAEARGEEVEAEADGVAPSKPKRRMRLGRKGFGAQAPDTPEIMSIVRDEFDDLDPDEPLDDAGYNKLINRIVRRCWEDMKDSPDDAPDDDSDVDDEQKAADELYAALLVAASLERKSLPHRSPEEQPVDLSQHEALWDGLRNADRAANYRPRSDYKDDPLLAALDGHLALAETFERKADEVPLSEAVQAEQDGGVVEMPTAELFDVGDVSASELADPEVIADAVNTEMTLADDLGVDEEFDPVDEEKALAHESLDRSPKKNWVERAGQLPAYIQHIAKDLHEERGMTMSRAIATAISICKKWAAGGKNVKPDTRAKAAKAVAEWEALKAKNAARRAAKSAGVDLTWFDVADGMQVEEVLFDHERYVADAETKTAWLEGQVEQKMGGFFGRRGHGGGGVRRVETPEGARRFGKPIGSIITAEDLNRDTARMKARIGQIDAGRQGHDGPAEGRRRGDYGPTFRGETEAAKARSAAGIWRDEDGMLHYPDEPKPGSQRAKLAHADGDGADDESISDEQMDKWLSAGEVGKGADPMKGNYPTEQRILEAARKLPPHQRAAYLRKRGMMFRSPAEKKSFSADGSPLTTDELAELDSLRVALD